MQQMMHYLSHAMIFILVRCFQPLLLKTFLWFCYCMVFLFIREVQFLYAPVLNLSNRVLQMETVLVSSTDSGFLRLITGTLYIRSNLVLYFVHRLVGCQGLLEDIPGRKKDNLQLLLSSPGESKSLLRSKRSSTKTYTVKEELSS